MSVRELGGYRLKDIDRPRAAVPARHRWPADRLSADSCGEGRGTPSAAAAGGPARRAGGRDRGRCRDPDLRVRAGRRRRRPRSRLPPATPLESSTRARAASSPTLASATARPESPTVKARTGSPTPTAARSHGSTRQRTDRSRRFPVGSTPSGIALGKGAVWVANSLDGTVSRIDPGTNTVVQTIDVGNGPAGVVYATGSVWVANTGDGTITEIDASRGEAGRTLEIPATELAFGAGTLWASQRSANQVVRLDPGTGKGRRPDPGRQRAYRDRLRCGRRMGRELARRDRLPDRSRDERGQGRDPGGQRDGGAGRGPARRLGQQPVRRHARPHRSADEPAGRSDQRRQPPSGRRPRRRQRARRCPPVRDRSPRRDPDTEVEPARRHGAGDRFDRHRRLLRPRNLAAPAGDRRRSRRIQPGQRPGRDTARARPRSLAPGSNRRRPDILLPAPPGHPLLERQRGQGLRLPGNDRARLRDRTPVTVLHRHRRRGGVQDGEALRPLARHCHGRRRHGQ